MIILVTGATAGFGLAIARRFASQGGRIIAAGRRAERLEALQAELGEAVLPLTLDVRDRAAVEAAISGLPAEWSAIDLLVNNAGLALGLNPAQSADLADWDQMVDTNIKGLMYMTRAVLPGMRARSSAVLGATSGPEKAMRSGRLARWGCTTSLPRNSSGGAEAASPGLPALAAACALPATAAPGCIATQAPPAAASTTTTPKPIHAFVRMCCPPRAARV